MARPARNHYLPDLHHLRLELEEAATPEGHAVRFGFNPLEFENFSWRGYAQMAPIQVGRGCLCTSGSAQGAGGPLKPQDWAGNGQGGVTPIFHSPPPAQDCGQADRDLP